jgi:hypothetical protein
MNSKINSREGRRSKIVTEESAKVIKHLISKISGQMIFITEFCHISKGQVFLICT